MQRCDDCNSNVDGERVLCVGCVDARASAVPVPGPDIDAARREAEEWLTSYSSLPARFRGRCEDEAIAVIRSLLAATAPAPSSPLAPDPERRADAMGRLVKSFETAEELRR